MKSCAHTVDGAGQACMAFRGGGGFPRKRRGDDWTCPNCSKTVFGSKDECFSCFAPRPGSAHTSAQLPAAPSPKCDAIKFSHLCAALERTVLARGNEKKLNILLPRKLKEHLGNESFFSYLRLVLPQLDRKRPGYGMKHSVLAKCYSDAMGLDPKTNSKAKRLVNYRDPTENSGATGDISVILEEVLLSKCGAGKKVTIGDVNRDLDALAADHSKAARQRVFMRLLGSYSAKEQKWLARLLLKEMKIGIKEESLLKFLHPDASNIYNLTTDLAKVCESCTSTTRRVREGLRLGSTIQPMLAKRMNKHEAAGKLMVGKRFAFETKLDGERMIVHKTGDECQYWTRNGNDYTQFYGAVMTPWIRSQIELRDAILDGEMLCWDKEDGLIPFGQNKSVAHEQTRLQEASQESSQWMYFVVFDVLLASGGSALASASRELAKRPHLAHQIAAEGLDGDMMTLPLEARRYILERVLKPAPQRITLVKQTVVNFDDEQRCIKEVRDQVDFARREQLEGVILKDTSAPYIAGEAGRASGNWMKLKPDYDEVDTFDLVVLGAYYGKGSRRAAKDAGDVSMFLCGILEERLDSPPPGMRSFDRVPGSEVDLAHAAEVAARAANEGMSSAEAKAYIQQTTGASAAAAEVAMFGDAAVRATSSSAAVAEGTPQPSAYPTVHTFCKVGTGYTKELLDSIRKRLRPHLQKYCHDRPPAHLRGWKAKVDDRPHFWIPLDKTLVFEVNFGEVISTDQFTSNLTLRFPRLVRERADKDWHQCETLAEVQEYLATGSNANTSAKRVSHAATKVGHATVKRKKPKLKATPTAIAHMAATDMTHVKLGEKSQLLRGLCFCVLPCITGGHFDMSESTAGACAAGGSNDGRVDRAGVEQELRRHGAETTINPSHATTHVLAAGEPLSAKVRNIVKAGSHDVLSIAWVVRCIGKGKLLEPEMADFIGHAAQDPAAQIGESLGSGAVDRFGDAYSVASDAVGLSRAFSAVDRAGTVPKIASLAEAMKLDDIRGDPAVLALIKDLCAEHRNLQSRVNALAAAI